MMSTLSLWELEGIPHATKDFASIVNQLIEMVNKTVIGWFFMVFFCVIHDFPPAAKEVQSEDRNTSPNALQRYKIYL